MLDGISAKVQSMALLSLLMVHIWQLLVEMVFSFIHYSCDFTSITYYKGTDIEHFNVGYLRVFDYQKEQLICGGKSYYGALLCCAWR